MVVRFRDQNDAGGQIVMSRVCLLNRMSKNPVPGGKQNSLAKRRGIYFRVHTCIYVHSIRQDLATSCWTTPHSLLIPFPPHTPATTTTAEQSKHLRHNSGRCLFRSLTFAPCRWSLPNFFLGRAFAFLSLLYSSCCGIWTDHLQRA